MTSKEAMAFSVPGEPRGQGRPRFGKTFSGRSITYKDERSARYENLIKLTAQNAGAHATDLPVRVSISAYLRPAKSWSKKRRREALAGLSQPTRKPDIDNVVKSVLDGLNGVAFHDDAQVVELYVTKRWSEDPRLDVQVIPIAAAEAEPAGEVISLGRRTA